MTITHKTRSRGWSVTINNWRPEDWEKIQSLGDWGIAGPEVGESGTPHIQGALYYKNKISFKNIKILLPKAHIEPWKGTALDNKKYIQGPYEKDGKFKPYNPDTKEWGTFPQQGKRTDLDTLRDSIFSGTRVAEIAVASPMVYHQYGRTLSYLEDLAMRQRWRNTQTRGTWYFGRTAVGKSHRAFDGYTPTTHYSVPLSDKGWWDAYTQQETVILNDFRGEIAFNDMLQMVDKWPYHVRRRGKEPMPFLSTHVIVTSSLHPKDIYSQSLQMNDKMEQFYRRFEIIELT